MQKHVQIGLDFVQDIPFLVEAPGIIVMHNERYDGGGYPKKAFLKGKRQSLHV